MLWTGYQRKYLADTSNQICVVKGRRLGFSEVVCFKRACRAAGLELLPDRPPRRTKPVPQNFVSAGLEQSKDLLRRTAFHLRAFEKVGPPLIKKQTATQIELTNGVFLRAFSSNPESIRGFEGDYFLDEFAAAKRQDKLWAAVSAAAKPTLGHAEGYHIIVVFTPLGDDNLAYEIARGRMKDSFSHHDVSIYQAVRDGFPVKVQRNGAMIDGTIEDLKAEIGDPDIFEQEFNLSFLSASTRYIPADVYEAAEYDNGDLPADFHAIGKTAAYAGIDVARRKDRTALTVVDRHGDVNWHRMTDVIDHSNIKNADGKAGVSFDDQEKWVDARIAQCGRVLIDKTGMGEGFAERMVSKWPGRVEAVDFTMTNKEVLATGLKLGLMRGKLRVRADDLELKREALSLRREFTELGNVRYLAPRQGGGHGDRAWSLALAENASGGAAQPTTAGRGYTHIRPPEAGPIARPQRGGWR